MKKKKPGRPRLNPKQTKIALHVTVSRKAFQNLTKKAKKGHWAEYVSWLLEMCA